MRFWIIAASLAVAAGPAADWRAAKLPGPVQAALRGSGYRLEDDGRVLGPADGCALSGEELQAALLRINLATQRLALERLRLLLRAGPPSPADAAALKPNLPEDAARALERGATIAELRAVTERDLSAVSAFFDGTRKNGGAEPVAMPRRGLAGADADTRALSSVLAAGFETRLASDSVGRRVLARLNAAPGRPTLPAVEVEVLGGDVAQYDYRRGALLLDRQTLVSSLTALEPPAARAALRLRLASRKGLIDYLRANPQALASYASKVDSVIVHELTHAWQDRRDPVMREIAAGRLPQALVLDYEVEAWAMKNLYIHSRLKSNPSAPVDDWELRDYEEMAARYASWNAALRADYASAHFNAMNLETLSEIQQDRVARAFKAGAPDAPALAKAAVELAAAGASQRWRLRRMARLDLRPLSAEAPGLLARRYWSEALAAPNDVEFSVLKKKAEAYADNAGDAALAAQIRARRRRGS
jgi:hypothetical protein